jgi:type II secretory pathway component GspD/PulD (secretin)
MRENKVSEERRVPILGRIPLLGFFFRKTVERSEKTNLLIFVTPRLVTDAKDNAEADAAWRERTGLQPESPPEK